MLEGNLMGSYFNIKNIIKMKDLFIFNNMRFCFDLFLYFGFKMKYWGYI